MKKIFSLSLIAISLLISVPTNAAKVATMILNGGDPQDVENLTEAIYLVGAAPNQTAVITLTEDATLNRTSGYHRGKPGKDAEKDRTWLNNGENITIDLAGHDITEASLRINIVNAKVQVINNGDKKSNIDASGYTQTFTLYGASEDDESVASDACYFKLGKNILLKGKYYMVCAMYYGSFAGTSIEGRPTYGMTIDIDGELKAIEGSAMANNGTMSFEKGNKAKCPIINISGTAKVIGSNTLVEYIGSNAAGATAEEKAVYKHYVAKGQSGNQLHKSTDAAVYGPGYSVWNIKGHLEGGIGLYIKSGVYNIEGADISATADEYWEPIAYSNGFIGAGSAIIFDANEDYGGDITMNITGDATVSSESGYAIQDINTNSPGTAVTNLYIVSGSFESNAGGDVIVTTPQLQQQLQTGTDCKISGGTYGSDIVDYLPNVGGVVTPVVDEYGNEVYVVNAMPEEAQEEGWLTDINEASETSYVKYEGAATADITLTKAETKCAYLTITNGQKLIVAANQTLSAGEIVLGEDAAIEVAPKGKLIVNGVNGLVAFQSSNLVLKANADGRGVFALNPDVKANKTPYATVEWYTTAGKIDNDAIWDLFTSPFAVLDTVYVKEGTKTGIAFQYHDATGWHDYTSRPQVIADLKPFQMVATRPSLPFGDGATYVFMGQLQGNISGKFALTKGFNYLGNGYAANMQAQKMISVLKESGAKVRTLLYTWTPLGGYEAHTGNFSQSVGELDAMKAFVLYADEDIPEIDLNYRTLIWENYENK